MSRLTLVMHLSSATSWQEATQAAVASNRWAFAQSVSCTACGRKGARQALLLCVFVPRLTHTHTHPPRRLSHSPLPP